jgi:hypothetical protein
VTADPCLEGTEEAFVRRAPHQFAGLGRADRPQQHQQMFQLPVMFAAENGLARDPVAEGGAIPVHQVRGVAAVFQNLEKQVFLGAEIAGHQGSVHAHIAGDIAHADIVITLARETLPGGRQDGGAGRLGIPRPGRDFAKQRPGPPD